MFHISIMANLETEFYELLKLFDSSRRLTWRRDEQLLFDSPSSECVKPVNNFSLTGKWPQNVKSHANVLSIDEKEFYLSNHNEQYC